MGAMKVVADYAQALADTDDRETGMDGRSSASRHPAACRNIWASARWRRWVLPAPGAAWSRTIDGRIGGGRAHRISRSSSRHRRAN